MNLMRIYVPFFSSYWKLRGGYRGSSVPGEGPECWSRFLRFREWSCLGWTTSGLLPCLLLFAALDVA